MLLPSLGSLPVDEIMDRWPDTIRVFLDHRMSCVGCPVGALHTLSDAACEYELTLSLLEDQMKRAILGGAPRD